MRRKTYPELAEFAATLARAIDTPLTGAAVPCPRQYLHMWAKKLSRLAAGEKIDAILNIKRAAHRPKADYWQPALTYYRLRILGHTPKKAACEVRTRFNRLAEREWTTIRNECLKLEDDACLALHFDSYDDDGKPIPEKDGTVTPEQIETYLRKADKYRDLNRRKRTTS